ncbi:MAG: 5'/3'-nucleotidase SurE [Candidatus Kariarchaeaceae archaeon]|jgi:5'-nucleotidase
MGETKLNILIGNDDGIQNTGIDFLSRYAEKWGNISIVAPASQQSAKGKSLTFDKPIRMNQAKTQSGLPAISYNAKPADSINIHEHLGGKPDVVLSGINAGDNTSIHSILTSGTCAVAMEAGLQDIPAFAFSIVVPSSYFFGTEIPGDLDKAAELSIRIARLFMKEVNASFWKKVMFINVNFPQEINNKTPILTADLETYKYKNHLVERTDPKGDKYYWLWGTFREDLNSETDTSLLFHKKAITISPVSMVETDYLFAETRRVVDLLNSKGIKSKRS